MSEQHLSISRAQLRKKLLSNGYTPLPATGKGVFIPKWSTLEVTEDWLDTYARANRYRNTGLRCDGLIAFDIDVLDQDLADDIEDIVEQRIGPTELCRYGTYPKRLLLYRLEGELGRSATTGKYGDHRVDLLCGPGRQFIAYGRHPGGHDYEWDDADPLQFPLHDLPACAHDVARETLTACEQCLIDSGLELVSNAYTREMASAFTLTPDTPIRLADGVETVWGDLRDQLDNKGLFGNVVRENGEFGDSDGVHFMLSANSKEPCAHDFVRGCTYWEYPVDAKQLAQLPPQPPTHGHMFMPQHYRDLLENWVILHDGTVRSVQRPGLSYRLAQFKETMEHRRMPDPNPPKNNPNKTLRLVDAWLADPAAKRAHWCEMVPDSLQTLIEDDSFIKLNTYRPPQHPFDGGELYTFDEFMRHLIPERKERNLFLDWLAIKVVHPDYRLHAMLMATQTMGTGRGTLERIISALLGEQYTQQVPLEHFLGRSNQGVYNAYMADSLLVSIPEALEEGDDAMQYSARRSAYERLKILCDPSSTTMQIRRKFGGISQQRVYASVLIATNHPKALAIPEEDRRIIVLKNTDTPLKKAPNNLMDRIIAWLADPANVGRLHRKLVRRVKQGKTQYDPFGMVPDTAARAHMIDAGKSDFDLAFEWVVDHAPGDVMTPKQLQNWITKGFVEMGLEQPDYRFIKPAIYRITMDRCARCLALNKSYIIKFRGVAERPWIIRNRDVWVSETLSNRVRDELDKNATLDVKKTNVVPFKGSDKPEDSD